MRKAVLFLYLYDACTGEVEAVQLIDSTTKPKGCTPGLFVMPPPPPRVPIRVVAPRHPRAARITVVAPPPNVRPPIIHVPIRVHPPGQARFAFRLSMTVPSSPIRVSDTPVAVPSSSSPGSPAAFSPVPLTPAPGSATFETVNAAAVARGIIAYKPGMYSMLRM